MIEKLKIRAANPMDAAELLAIRRDAIMALAEAYVSLPQFRGHPESHGSAVGEIHGEEGGEEEEIILG